MADIRVEIQINPQFKLIRDYSKIIDISTHTFAISNPDEPEYNAYPNSGYLKLKDDDLEIYNLVLQGAFDDYQYSVDFFINDEKVAHHIINERPEYDFADKTISFNLGNFLDSAEYQPFDTYVYPLKSQTLEIIFRNVLKGMYGLSDSDIDNILNKPCTQIVGDQTFMQRFQKITIPYPYFERKTYRQVLQNILAVAQCGLYINKDNDFCLINLSGKYFALAPDLSKVIYIQPQEINKPFLPSVILSNKYDKVTVEHKDVEIENHYNEIVDVLKSKDTEGGELIENLTNEEVGEASIFVPFSGNQKSLFAQVYTDYIKINNYKKEITVYKKNNLQKFLGLSVFYGKNGDLINPQYTFNVIEKKVLKRQGIYIHATKNLDGTITKERIINLTARGTDHKKIKIVANEILIDDAGDWFVYNNQSTTETTDLYDNIISTNEFVTYNYDGRSIPIDTNFSHTPTPIQNTLNDKVVADFNNVMTTKSVVYIHCAGQGVSTPNVAFIKDLTDCTAEFITYTAKEIKITYYGNYSLIKFNDSAYSVDTTTGKTLNAFTLNSSKNELLQTENAKRIHDSIKEVFNKGLHTGELTVIPHNGRLYEIGDIVVPCKDYSNTPILNKVYYQVIDITTSYEGGAVFQKLILREVKQAIDNIII